MHDRAKMDAMHPPSSPERPYQALALAVLVATLRPLATSRNPAARRKALQWLQSEDGRFWIDRANVNADVLIEKVQRDGLPEARPRVSWDFRNLPR